jgi:hypothetical protein
VVAEQSVVARSVVDPLLKLVAIVDWETSALASALNFIKLTADVGVTASDPPDAL